MSVIVSGCIAFDAVLMLSGRINRYNGLDRKSGDMAFLVRETRKSFGGCAANISYGLHLMSQSPIPVAVVGEDFTEYRAYLDSLGIDLSRVFNAPRTVTSSCTILSDDDGAQLTAFDLGAAELTDRISIGDTTDISLGVVAPSNRSGMLRHVGELSADKVPILLLPGQVITVFSGPELSELIQTVDYLVTNEEEARVLQQCTGLTRQEIARQLDAFIVTRGSQGSLIYVDGSVSTIPAYEVEQAIDTTGCGDAYVAGLISGILAKTDWPTAGRLGSLLGGLNATEWGAQSYCLGTATLDGLFYSAFACHPSYSR